MDMELVGSSQRFSRSRKIA